MAKLSAVEAARLRMAMIDEGKALRTGAMNASDQIGGEYPRMLYKATTEPDQVIVAEGRNGRPDEVATINRFDGHLCETLVVDDADEAEAAFAEGWDVTPAAAHGVASATKVAATAKDAEIEALKAQIAAMEAIHQPEGTEAVRRGRPPKPRDEQGNVLNG